MVTWHAGVVVGVDGSWEASHALEWAVAVAERHDARLTVLSTYIVPPAVAAPGTGLGHGRPEADRAVERAIEQLEGRHLDVVGEVVQVGSVRVLLRRSRTSDLVVVGRRGLSGIDRVFLGSVSAPLSAMAHGSVAVVPAGASTQAPRRVVAAVDANVDPGTILEFAFDEAASSGCSLDIVHAIDPTLVAGVLPSPEIRREAWRAGARNELESGAAGWADKYPQVDHHVVVEIGRPTDVLLGRLRSDDVVVVDGQRHHPAVGRLFWSVTDRVLRMAPCPVVVAHAADSEQQNSETRKEGSER